MSPILKGIVASGKTGNLIVPAYFPIATYVVTSGVSGITFSSIPQTYKHLEIRGSDQQTYGADDTGYTGIQFNGVSTGSTWNRHQMWGTGSTYAAYGLGAGNINWGTVGTANLVGSRTQFFGGNRIFIPDYTNTTKYKNALGFGGLDIATSGSAVGIYSSAWASSAAITQVTMNGSNGNFAVGSVYTLYGIKG